MVKLKEFIKEFIIQSLEENFYIDRYVEKVKSELSIYISRYEVFTVEELKDFFTLEDKACLLRDALLEDNESDINEWFFSDLVYEVLEELDKDNLEDIEEIFYELKESLL